MSDRANVLFVDDERRVLSTMRMLFRGEYNNAFANSAQEALDHIKDNPVDVIVSDQRMPGMTGVDLLREAKNLRPEAMRILLTGYSDLNAIIGSINEGEIFRFVNKPWVNQDLKDTVAQAVAAAKATAHAIVESTDSAAATPEESELPSILVLDEDELIGSSIQQAMGSKFRVVSTSTIEGALDLMEQEEVGVVITDTRVDNQSVVSLLGTLKEHNPEIVSMIVTARADAGMAIELINQGQIYRLITKPLRETQCKLAVTSALNQHRKMTKNADLVKRYGVEKPKETDQAVMPLANSLLNRIKSLRSLVKRTG